MGIQDNFNKTIRNVAIASFAKDISKSLKEKGIKDEEELDRNINNLKVEIAISKDEGKPTKEKEKLLNEYQTLKDEIKKFKEEEKSESSNTVIILAIVFGFFAVLVALVLLSSI